MRPSVVRLQDFLTDPSNNETLNSLITSMKILVKKASERLLLLEPFIIATAEDYLDMIISFFYLQLDLNELSHFQSPQAYKTLIDSKINNVINEITMTAGASLDHNIEVEILTDYLYQFKSLTILSHTLKLLPECFCPDKMQLFIKSAKYLIDKFDKFEQHLLTIDIDKTKKSKAIRSMFSLRSKTNEHIENILGKAGGQYTSREIVAANHNFKSNCVAIIDSLNSILDLHHGSEWPQLTKQINLGVLAIHTAVLVLVVKKSNFTENATQELDTSFDNLITIYSTKHNALLLSLLTNILPHLKESGEKKRLLEAVVATKTGLDLEGGIAKLLMLLVLPAVSNLAKIGVTPEIYNSFNQQMFSSELALFPTPDTLIKPMLALLNTGITPSNFDKLYKMKI